MECRGLPVIRAVRDPGSLAALFSGLAAGRTDPAWYEDCVGYVLGDLAAARGDEAVAAALCGPPAESIELRLLWIPDAAGETAGRCLLDGALNLLRGDGTHRIVASSPPIEPRHVLLLRASGFRPDGGPIRSATRPGRHSSMRLFADL